jgi:hypothetical protein
MKKIHLAKMIEDNRIYFVNVVVIPSFDETIGVKNG